jgi:hypothetical protein
MCWYAAERTNGPRDRELAVEAALVADGAAGVQDAGALRGGRRLVVRAQRDRLAAAAQHRPGVARVGDQLMQ